PPPLPSHQVQPYQVTRDQWEQICIEILADASPLEYGASQRRILNDRAAVPAGLGKKPHSGRALLHCHDNGNGRFTRYIAQARRPFAVVDNERGMLDSALHRTGDGFTPLASQFLADERI